MKVNDDNEILFLDVTRSTSDRLDGVFCFHLELFRSDLLGGLIICLVLLLIELIDWIRIIVIFISQEKIWNQRIFWLLNIILPPLNGKRCLFHLLKSSSDNLCSQIFKDEILRSRLQFIDENSDKNRSKHFLLSFVQIFVQMIFLCLIDLGFFVDLSNRIRSEDFDDNFREDQLDDDVRVERTSLLSNEFSTDDSPLILVDLVKKYPLKSNLAVNHLSFHVERGQCFGLLGFNGAG